MIHGALQYTRVCLNTTLEAVAVTVHSEKRYTVCSIYLSPNRSVDKSEIRSIIHQLPRPFLLLGDLNGKHPLWDSNNPPNQRGKDIENRLAESMATLSGGRATNIFSSKPT